MGKLYSKIGGKARNEQLARWKSRKDAIWNTSINETKVKMQFLRKRRITEDNKRSDQPETEVRM